MMKKNIQIVDEDGVVEDRFTDENEAMDRYNDLIDEEFEFVGTVMIVEVLREIY